MVMVRRLRDGHVLRICARIWSEARRSETPMLKNLIYKYSPQYDDPFMNDREREYFRN